MEKFYSVLHAVSEMQSMSHLGGSVAYPSSHKNFPEIEFDVKFEIKFQVILYLIITFYLVKV